MLLNTYIGVTKQTCYETTTQMLLDNWNGVTEYCTDVTKQRYWRY